MTRRYKRMAILHKLETAYGTDIKPAAADNLLATNVTFTPIEGEEVSRALMLPYLGNQGVILTGTYARLEFDIEIAGSGTAGTAPKWGSIMRICGFAQTVQAGTGVTYSIVEDDLESGSLYFVHDGVQHIMVGCRGNVSMTIAPKAIPHFRFTITGLLGEITDLAQMPAASQTGWETPVEVSKVNTTMQLHGWDSVAENLAIDLGNTVTPRFLIGSAGVIISDRATTGTAVVEATKLATTNWFDKALTRVRGALALSHGKKAGNIVEISGPAVEIGKPTSGQTDNIINYSLPLSFVPVTGRDELKIVVK